MPPLPCLHSGCPPAAAGAGVVPARASRPRPQSNPSCASLPPPACVGKAQVASSTAPKASRSSAPYIFVRTKKTRKWANNDFVVCMEKGTISYPVPYILRTLFVFLSLQKPPLIRVATESSCHARPTSQIRVRKSDFPNRAFRAIGRIYENKQGEQSRTDYPQR